MKALVLEKKLDLRLREIQIPETLGPNDVRIAVRAVGVCGSDVHFYEHGEIGHFVVREPMVLGHEAAGTVIEAGANVKHLKVGDRVCMEPGIPDPNSRAAKMGIYNLDPAVRFWAAPPYHGCLRPTLVHPAAFTYRLPDNVSHAEGAMVEPLAVAMHAAAKAEIKPGDRAVVMGAGTIGMLTALAALAGGCSEVIIADRLQPKLDMAAGLGPITPVNIDKKDLRKVVADRTGGWGAELVFEASGSEEAAIATLDQLCPGGKVIFIGCPGKPVPFEMMKALVREATIKTIFRYANVYDRAVAMLGSGRINVKPFITDNYDFKDGVKAFEYAVKRNPKTVKIQITLPEKS